MKNILLIAIFASGYISKANSITLAEKMGDLKKGQCFKIQDLRWSIIQKLSKREYLMTGDGALSRGLAVMKTKKASYNSTGFPVGVNLKKVGSRQIETVSGFTKTASVWEECGYDPQFECSPLPPDMNFARPNRTKNSKCY